MNNVTRERVARYIVVREDSNRIVARTMGTHAIMDNVIGRLEERHPGVTFFYDDDAASLRYLPMDGAGMTLSVSPMSRRWYQ